MIADMTVKRFYDPKKFIKGNHKVIRKIKVIEGDKVSSFKLPSYCNCSIGKNHSESEKN
jgi:hypothetical protein